MHPDGTISISVNGGHRRVRDGLTIAELASELGLEPNAVTVERNFAEVPRAILAELKVEDGDELEILRTVGSGARD